MLRSGVPAAPEKDMGPHLIKFEEELFLSISCSWDMGLMLECPHAMMGWLLNVASKVLPLPTRNIK